MQNSQNQNTNVVSFPERLSPLDEVVEIHASQSLGITADVYVHEIARKLPFYNLPITCLAQGVDNNGNNIKINSIGRWFFGVPGYQSHIRIVAQGNKITIYYPKKAPELVHKFLQELKQQIEIISTKI